MNCKWDWIPVTERLPEFDESTKLYPLVLVSLRDGRVATGCYRDDDERWCCTDENGWWSCTDVDGFDIVDYSATGEVTAWMPMPEPYIEPK